MGLLSDWILPLFNIKKKREVVPIVWPEKKEKIPTPEEQEKFFMEIIRSGYRFYDRDALLNSNMLAIEHKAYLALVRDRRDIDDVCSALTNKEEQTAMRQCYEMLKAEYNLGKAAGLTIPKAHGKTFTMDWLKDLTTNNNEVDTQADRAVASLQRMLRSHLVDYVNLSAVESPSTIQLRILLQEGFRFNRLANLEKEIQAALEASTVRILAPIPCTNLFGIEIPKKMRETVNFKEIYERCKNNGLFHRKPLAVPLGIDSCNEDVVIDLRKMPHLLVAGTTGSGKSVCLNTIIATLLLNNDPAMVQLVLIDPKRSEFAPYEGIKHLYVPVAYDTAETNVIISNLVQEMERRYAMFQEQRVKDIDGYHERGYKLPYIVAIVEEFADLVAMSKGKKQSDDNFIVNLCRLAQKSRACGIHLIIATQRPSVDVVVGIIKANFPSRIAFRVSSGVDSKTILDTVGADKLSGNGDMLFKASDQPDPVRVQGPYIALKN